MRMIKYPYWRLGCFIIILISPVLCWNYLGAQELQKPLNHERELYKKNKVKLIQVYQYSYKKGKKGKKGNLLFHLTYDRNGLLIGSFSYLKDLPGAHRLYKYDEEENLIEKRSFTFGQPNSTYYSYKFDSLNRISEQTSEHETQYFQYDTRGNLIQETHLYRGKNYPETFNLDKYEYDEFNRKVRMDRYRPDNTKEFYFTFKYDETGNLIQRTKFEKEKKIRIRTYEYDDQGNQIYSNRFDNVKMKQTQWTENEFAENNLKIVSKGKQWFEKKEYFREFVYEFFNDTNTIEFSLDTNLNHFQRAVALKKQGLYVEAIEEYNLELGLHPNNTKALTNRGNLKSLINDDEGAIADYNLALRLDPKNPEIYYNRAGSYLSLNQIKNAINDFDRAIELGDHEDYYLNRGRAKKLVGLFDEAIRDYGKALELNPMFYDAYFNRANLKRDLKDYDGAIEDFTKAMSIDPSNVQSYMNRGNTKSLMNDAKGAIRDYDKALSIEPENALVHLNKALAHIKLKKYKKAVDDCTRSILIDPYYALTYFTRANALHQLGYWLGECNDLAIAVELGHEKAKLIYEDVCQ
ncbi:MAG: tetratricopeptide repeat protein [Bacteroidetes bacterium]|nr:tetratricopeptide repeat protein [Bacteroidota bacterium]